jgi:signal transduction histidine kinase
MTGNFFPDWAILAISLFNTFLLLWLGLTVFLNAEERVWGIWLATGGLLLGAIFFISHSAILGHGISPITPGLNFWWQIGWIPVSALPLVWYVVMLWYSGFWERRTGTDPAGTRLYKRHKAWFYLATLTGLMLIGFLIFANPLPSFSQLAASDFVTGFSIGGIPLLILAYPVYTLLCTGLALDVLRRPEPSGRLMGDLARTRARRWLISASLILLLVSLLVGWVMVWIVRRVQPDILSFETVEVVSRFDFVIETLIAIAVLLLGQAVVTYEVFTGKTLPRRGLSQYWRRAVMLAAGYSLILAWSLTLQLRPIYSLLISMVLMVVFYALLAWRAYAERERFIQNLRPFVAHQGLFEGILKGEKNHPYAGVEDVFEPFHALCADILETRQACLVPLGELAPLSGAPLNYPKGSGFSLTSLREVISLLASPAEIGIPMAPDQDDGMVFAVSLWNARGLIGVLLLGEKLSGSLYTQEEIEIARAVGEHLMDTKASMEMARRLISLQRQRLVQSQILDQKTRRVLHDEILPRVHTSLLNLTARQNEQGERNDLEIISQLEEIHRQLADLLRTAPSMTIQALNQFGLIGALRRTIEVDLHGSFDEVAWDVQPEGERQLAGIPMLVAEVLFFAAREVVRNAARHGRQKGDGTWLCLSIGLKYQDGLVITIEDNGLGFPSGEQALFAEGKSSNWIGEEDNPGSTDSLSSRQSPADGGSGQGLALHSTMMAVIGGLLMVESAPGQYTRVTLELPETAWQRWE